MPSGDDGILLHPILPWHHMLSTSLPPLDMGTMHTNMLWDGLFHAFVWVVTLAGIFTLWSSGQEPHALPGTTWLTGWLVVGWTLFNFTEGLVNHHILGIHHVRYQGDVFGAEPSLAWGLGFVMLGGPGLMLAGAGLISAGQSQGQRGLRIKPGRSWPMPWTAARRKAAAPETG